ncbi:hypothetical protein GRI72_02955 [Altererythrobacter marinus]|uniref:Peptidase M15A C-terminal domain-containing protein n=1 Tax=Pelagerythrobacter marinus TaxID=538382 RepID=A0ABW9UYN1_9SPHN|nr:M15 family metallopeptidase [Pelagerythrobacter marinus]MXO67792.1 hypothetical protein [Pelagerythrobacter marinus]
MATPVAGFDADFDPLGWARQQGFTPTSGFRTQAHQDALRAQGLTKTRHSSHTRGDALDFAVPKGMTKAQAIAMVQRQYPGAKAIPSNGNSIHVTFPGWGKAPDVSGSRRRYGGR